MYTTAMLSMSQASSPESGMPQQMGASQVTYAHEPIVPVQQPVKVNSADQHTRMKPLHVDAVLLAQELELKTGPLTALLQGPKRLRDESNINCLWARLLVDELCRQGCNTFCIAPGAWPQSLKPGLQALDHEQWWSEPA